MESRDLHFFCFRQKPFTFSKLALRPRRKIPIGKILTDPGLIQSRATCEIAKTFPIGVICWPICPSAPRITGWVGKKIPIGKRRWASSYAGDGKGTR
jgi:hypothetical protein